MKKIVFLLGCLVCLVWINECASSRNLKERSLLCDEKYIYREVQVGKTTESEVLNVFGPPQTEIATSISFKVWNYSVKFPFQGYCNLKISFQKGIVASKDTLRSK